MTDCKTNGTAISAPADGNAATVTALNRGYFLLLALIALVYAFLSNFRKVSDPDLFWQLATGRWVAQHHHVFSTDIFSYTATGQPWIYPVGSGLLFYLAFLIGRYSLISLMGAVSCAATTALLLRRGSAATAAVAIIAVPLIVMRSTPRAEMFTLVIFVAYLSILWEYFQSGRAPLWLLPVMMLAWVNLHPGFVAGLAALAVFAGFEGLRALSLPQGRLEALQRFRKLMMWLAVTALATLVNPWGWNIYQVLVRQSRATRLHSAWIAEWGSLPLNWTAAATAFSIRNVNATFYLLLCIAVIAALVAIFQREFAAAILLVVAAYAGTRHIRMEGVAACVVVVVGGWVLAKSYVGIASHKVRATVAVSVVVLLGALAGVRTVEFVRHRNYSLLTFGRGLSSWLPEGGVQFIEREKPPGQIFNTYDEGGYMLWRLGQTYPDYFDGRAIPFGPERFERAAQLSEISPDSSVWQQEADRYDINTILLPLSRFEGVLNSLRTFCNSKAWRPVYLDETSAVFVRVRPETQDLIQRSQVDCAMARLPQSPSASTFQQWADAAGVLAALGRNREALGAVENARAIFPDNPFIPWLRGNVFELMDRHHDAEREYRAALKLEPGESAFWFALATCYKHQGRISETIDAQRQAIDLSYNAQPHELVKLAQLYLDTKQPKQALQTFDEAVRTAPADIVEKKGMGSFRYQIALGRAAAWQQLGDPHRAASFDDEAARDLYPAQKDQ